MNNRESTIFDYIYINFFVLISCFVSEMHYETIKIKLANHRFVPLEINFG